jgi:hypothetical protein
MREINLKKSILPQPKVGASKREHREDSYTIRKKMTGGQAPKRRMEYYLHPLDFV